MGTNFSPRSPGLYASHKKNCGPRCLASRAAVSIQQKEADDYLRFVLRAAFGFAAAFVFAFFAVFFRAMAM
jgi:hypothetical protein